MVREWSLPLLVLSSLPENKVSGGLCTREIDYQLDGQTQSEGDSLPPLASVQGPAPPMQMSRDSEYGLVIEASF